MCTKGKMMLIIARIKKNYYLRGVIKEEEEKSFSKSIY